MAYPGLAFALLVGVAIGSAIYYFFNQETDQKQYQQNYNYANSDRTDYEDRYWNDRGSGNQNRSRPSSSKAEDTCSICLDSFRSSSKRKLTCGHMFHVSCIERWMQEKSECPNCRKRFH